MRGATWLNRPLRRASARPFGVRTRRAGTRRGAATFDELAEARDGRGTQSIDCDEVLDAGEGSVPDAVEHDRRSAPGADPGEKGEFGDARAVEIEGDGNAVDAVGLRIRRALGHCRADPVAEQAHEDPCRPTEPRGEEQAPATREEFGARGWSPWRSGGVSDACQRIESSAAWNRLVNPTEESTLRGR